MTLYNYIKVYKMKIYTILALLPLASSTLLSGPFGDGKFLSHPTLQGEPPCPTGQYNALVVSSLGDSVENHDGTQYVVQCKSCSTGTFKVDVDGKGGYTEIISGLSGAHSVFNREECCYNSEHPVCIEQIREYKRGCQSTGAYEASTNEAGFGTDSTCTA
tara:strand:- start:1411 stop:1890 length:480 start_codon:yes stop_codon:yes gene_type:complete